MSVLVSESINCRKIKTLIYDENMMNKNDMGRGKEKEQEKFHHYFNKSNVPCPLPPSAPSFLPNAKGEGNLPDAKVFRGFTKTACSHTHSSIILLLPF